MKIPVKLNHALMTYPPPTHDTIFARSRREVNPGRTYCLMCGYPWGIGLTEKTNPRMGMPHVTEYWSDTQSRKMGIFVLCEACWIILGNPEARIEYYDIVVKIWEAQGTIEPGERELIGKAVANGG